MYRSSRPGYGPCTRQTGSHGTTTRISRVQRTRCATHRICSGSTKVSSSGWPTRGASQVFRELKLFAALTRVLCLHPRSVKETQVPAGKDPNGNGKNVYLTGGGKTIPSKEGEAADSAKEKAFLEDEAAADGGSDAANRNVWGKGRCTRPLPMLTFVQRKPSSSSQPTGLVVAQNLVIEWQP